MRIGIYSGSFDPIHAGHAAFAVEAAKVCGLETVVFCPERFPRRKPDVTPLDSRVQQMNIALQDTPFLVAELPSDRFTVHNTLPELKKRYPNAEFVFLVGSDVAVHSLPHWHDLNEISKTSSFAVGMRETETPDDVRSALNPLDIKYTLISTSHSHLSSSAVRNNTDHIFKSI